MAKKTMRAEKAMDILRVIMWICGVLNLAAAAALGIFALDAFGFRAALRGSGLPFVLALLDWVFVMPPVGGFGLGLSVFFLRDQLRIGRFMKSYVFLIILYSLSLVPGLLVLGSLFVSMFTR